MRIKFFQNLFNFVRGRDSSKLQNVESAKQKYGVGDVPDSFEASPGRGNFFSGKLLTESDFTQEQNYNQDKGSDVVTEFQSGDVRSPYIMGNLWNTADRPPVENDNKDDSKKDDP